MDELERLRAHLATLGDLRVTVADAVAVAETTVDGDREQVRTAIKAFNDEHSPHHRAVRAEGPGRLDIMVRAGDGALLAGLASDLAWGWLLVEELWLSEPLRGRGVGRRLLALAEQAAHERGCRRAAVRTFSFQAPGFYEKQGYRVVGELADYPPGAALFWLRKDWGAQGPATPDKR